MRFTQQWPGGIQDVASGYITGFRLSGRQRIKRFEAVHYRVSYVDAREETTGFASLTYRTAGGGTEQRETAQLPWVYTVGRPGTGAVFYVSAQNQSYGGCVTVAITIGDAVVKSSTSCGQHTIATASGKF